MTLNTPNDMYDYSPKALPQHDMAALEVLTARDKALIDALDQIDRQFRTGTHSHVANQRLQHEIARKQAKKAQGPVQKGQDWVKSIPKKPFHSNTPPMTNKPSNPANIMQAMMAIFRLTAQSIQTDMNSVTATWSSGNLEKLFNLVKDSHFEASNLSNYDHEILEEQLIEVGDQFSPEFLLGVSAAVAVLLEGKHLTDFSTEN